MTKYISLFLFFVFTLAASAQDIGYKYNPTTKLGWDYLNPQIDSTGIGLNGNLSGVATLNDALNLIDDLSGSFGEGSLGTLTTTQNLWDGSSASLSLIARLSGANDPTFVFSDGLVNLTVGGFQIAGSSVLTIASAPGAAMFSGFTGNLLGVTTLQGFANAFDAFTAGGTGTVTSVSMTVPGFMSIAGSPITTSGTLAVSLASQIANTVFAGPITGSATPTFRSLVDSDIPAAITRDSEAAAAYSTLGHNHDGTYQPNDVDLDSVAVGITGVVRGLGNGLGYQVAGNSAVLLATTASFLTADETKLDGIEAGATADQTDAEIETAYNNRVTTVSQVNAEAGTSTTVFRWTPQRVAQAIAALAPGGTDDQTATEVPFSPTGNIAATDTQAAIVELDTEKQAADADLTDLADGSLTGTKVGFADTDSNFAATNVQAAIEELDDVNGSGPNAADGKIAWSQIVNMPSGFADGTDDGAGGGSGTMSTIQEDGIQVGGNDIVTLNFATGFDLLESPDTKISISLDAAEMESSLEGVLDLQDLQGAVTDAQVPDGITITLANTATTLATPRTIGNVSFNGSANIVPETIAVVDSTDATSSVAIFDSATGSLQPKTDAGITYNASTGALTATALNGSLAGATGLPISTGVSGLGTGIATFLATPTIANFDTVIGITGTPSATTFWRGDNTWATPAGGGDVTAASAFGTTDVVIVSDGTGKGVKSTSIGVTGGNTIEIPTANVTTFNLLDSDASHSYSFTPGNLSANAAITLGAGAITISGSNTGDQTITLIGDVTGSGTGSFAATVGDDTHAHTGATLSGIDISADTNLTGDTENVLTGDTLSIGAAITRDSEWNTIPFITQTSTAAITGEQALASLATGILKNTTTTGVLGIAVAGDFPTLNQNTTGSAATLTTPRAIYGNNFDGSVALTQVIASTYGGTGNGFTAFTGPATTEKVFTLPNASATLLYSGGALGTPSSGTLTNATGLPISTGVSGLGTGVATLLGTFTLANFDTAAGLTGTADATTFLRGDGAWVTPSGGGDVTAASAFGTTDVIIVSDGTGKGVKSTSIGVSGGTTMTVPTVNVDTFGLNDSDDSHQYTFVPGNLSGAASITLGAGNITIGGSNTGDQTGATVSFADTDSNFTATSVGAAIEELDDTNGSGPNAADGKVSWTQLVGVPAGFADGTDDGTGGGFDLDALTEATEADLGDADLLGVSDGGTEKKITLVNFVDYLESLTISLSTLSVNTFELMDNVDQSHGLSFVANENLTSDIQLQLDLNGATRTLEVAGNSVLSGTNTGDQTITLTGEVTGTGTGSFATTIADSVSVTNWDLQGSSAQTPAANDNDTSIATTAYTQTELTAYASDTVTFTNKMFDAAATGNVAKRSDYIYLVTPHLADGTNATINTTATSITYGHATFSNSVDQATNYVEYYIMVPEKLDTAVVPRARLKVLLGGADTGSHRYVISSVSVADSAVPTASTLANAINIDFAGDGSGASGDVETSAWTSLTGWNAALTAGQTWRIRLARDGDTSDTSTVNSTELGLVIEYGETQ